MITQPKLGRLERVDLRSCWVREDSDFTPWLASEDNIAHLGEAIGMELEVQQEEASVGPFRADILCRNTATDELVIIENQLERTDHTHLGQTLTYAAGLDAVTVVWIAARFTEEHRAALDWLNRITEEGIQFFGIEIEVWRIGDSEPAPQFHIVAKPNDWSKTVKEAASRRGALTAGQEAQVQFWAELGAYLTENGGKFRAPKPYPANWAVWGLGRTGTGLEVIANAKEVHVAVNFDTQEHGTWFQKALTRKAEIEGSLGFELNWSDKVGNRNRNTRISTEADTRSDEGRKEVFPWILEHMTAFDRVFRPLIKALDDSPLPEDGNDQ